MYKKQIFLGIKLKKERFEIQTLFKLLNMIELVEKKQRKIQL